MDTKAVFIQCKIYSKLPLSSSDVEYIRAHPEYFPWEHKYWSIPDEVHQAFYDECYPKVETPAIEEGIGLYAGIHSSDEPAVFTKKSLYELLDMLQQIDIEKREREQHRRGLWHKHYNKYKLPYRE